jgi:hypothetical protein
MTHLDLVAAAFTASSTALLATQRRFGFVMLAIGACLWAVVALRSRYNGRPVWGMLLSSAWTLTWAVCGWWMWRA